jgi:uncharacterized protein involved in outer membrane biogenesis
MVLIVVAVVVYVHSLDFERQRANLATELREVTGRAVEINGTVDLSLGLRSAFIINDLRIGNAAWGTRRDLLKVGKVEAQFQLLPLLAGRIKIERLRLVQADLWLETNSKGEPNWILPVRQPTGSKDARNSHAAQRQLLGMIGVAGLDLVAGRVSFRDGRSGDIQVLAISDASADGDGFAQAGAVKVDGSWNGLPMTFEGQVGPLAALLREGANAYPIDLSGKLAGMQIDAKGTVAHPTRGEGIRLQFEARADRLKGFVPAFGEAAARLNHVTMSGVLDFRDTLVKIEDLIFGIGDSSLAGTVSLNLATPVPQLNADLTSSSIDLMAVTGRPKGEPVESTVGDSGAAPGILPATPLDFSALRSFNGTLNFRGSSVSIGTLILQAVEMKMTLQDGMLNVAPVTARFRENAIEMQASLDVGPVVPRFSLGFQSPGLQIGPFVQQLDGIKALDGQVTVDISIEGTGDSLTTMIGSSSGQALILMGEGRIAVDPLEKNLFNSADMRAAALAGMLLPQGEKSVGIRCSAYRLILRDGIARSIGTIVESDAAMVTVTGRIDLAKESVALRITPYTKGGKLAVDTAVKLTGALTVPRLSAASNSEIRTVNNLSLAWGDLVDRLQGKSGNECVRRMRHISSEAQDPVSRQTPNTNLPSAMPE